MRIRDWNQSTYLPIITAPIGCFPEWLGTLPGGYLHALRYRTTRFFCCLHFRRHGVPAAVLMKFA